MLYYVRYVTSSLISMCLFFSFHPEIHLLIAGLMAIIWSIGYHNGIYYENTKFKKVTLLLWPVVWVTIVAFLQNYRFPNILWLISIVAMPLMYGLALRMRDTGASLDSILDDEELMVETSVTINDLDYKLVVTYLEMTDKELNHILQEFEGKGPRTPNEFKRRLFSSAKGKITQIDLFPDELRREFDIVASDFPVS